jgi:hypothetical protein
MPRFGTFVLQWRIKDRIQLLRLHGVNPVIVTSKFFSKPRQCSSGQEGRLKRRLVGRTGPVLRLVVPFRRRTAGSQTGGNVGRASAYPASLLYRVSHTQVPQMTSTLSVSNFIRGVKRSLREYGIPLKLLGGAAVLSTAYQLSPLGTSADSGYKVLLILLGMVVVLIAGVVVLLAYVGVDNLCAKGVEAPAKNDEQPTHEA